MSRTSVKLPPSDGELARLVEAFCDGAITPLERDRLESLLAGDRDAQLYYVAYLDMHAQVQWLTRGEGREARDEGRGMVVSPAGEEGSGFRVQGSGFGFWESESANPKSQIPNQQISPSDSPAPPIILDLLLTSHYPLATSHYFVGGPVFSYMVASVIVGLMLLGAWAYKITHYQQIVDNRPQSINRPDMQFVGQITGMSDCRWSDPKTEAYLGASVPLGRKYALASGLMEITYDTGAKVILQGPCTYTVESRAGGFLSLGKLTATVVSGQWPVASEGPGARGQGPENHKSEIINQKSNPQSLIPNPFVVRTPTAIVTDLGTEFGVEVSEDGNTSSHVFQGQVKIAIISGDGVRVRTVLLKEHESLVVDRGGVELRRRTGDGAGFVRSLAPKPSPDPFDLSKGTLVFSETFDVDSLDPAVGYRTLEFTSAEISADGGKPSAAVVRGVLLLQRAEEWRGGHSVDSAMTKRTFSGRLIVYVDIGADSSHIGDSHIALRLGDLAVLFHPGCCVSHKKNFRGVFRVERRGANGEVSDTVVSNTDVGFISDVDTLHHLFVYFDGKSTFHVCLIDGLNPRKVFRTSFTDPGLGTAPFTVGVHRSGGPNRGMFDNLRVYRLPKADANPATFAPTAHDTDNDLD